MRKIIYFFALLAFGFTSCDKQNAIAEDRSFPNPPEVVKSKLPKFPAEVLYVVGREYETIKDGTSMKAARQKMNGKIANINEMTLNRYVEDRLTELYPEEAYVGIANDMVAEGLQTIDQYQDYLDRLSAYELSIGIYVEPEPVTPAFTTVEDEIELMNMTPDEEISFRRLNQLAISSDFATIDDFDNIIYNSKSNDGKNKVTQVAWGWISAAGIVTLGVYTVARTLICKKRAENKQNEFYGGTGIVLNSGTQNDAFKHIYVSMMLRRYLTELMSWAVMDFYWENTSENKPCDKYMDLHNNYVGRHTKYSTFRGSFWSDMHKWELWGARVRDFVNTTSNSVKKTWNLSTIESTVKSDKNSTDKNKYIYWKDGK